MAPEARPARKHSVDLIRLEEGLAQELDIITPYLTPADYLDGLKRFSARWWQQDQKPTMIKQNSLEIRKSTPQSQWNGDHPQEFVPNMRCEVVSLVTVREGESFETEVVAELEVGTEVSILVRGSGRRVQIRTLDDKVVGWASVRTKSDIPLINMVRNKDQHSHNR